MSVAKHKALLDKITLMAKENRLHEIKDINQSFKTGFHVTGGGGGDDYSISTLLGLAAYEADVLLINALLKAGANVSTPMTGYRQLYTPLHLVIYGAYYKKDDYKALDDRMKIIDILHEHGADLQWTGDDLYSWTPLATANYHQLPILGAKLLRVGADPTAPSSAYGIGHIKYLTSTLSFLELACEEARNKYEFGNEYNLPKGLHIDVLNKLQTLQFKYSTKNSKLVTVNMEVQNGGDEGTHIWEHSCYPTEIKPSHTDVFDLSEVKYSGSLAIEDILGSL